MGRQKTPTIPNTPWNTERELTVTPFQICNYKHTAH